MNKFTVIMIGFLSCVCAIAKEPIKIKLVTAKDVNKILNKQVKVDHNDLFKKCQLKVNENILKSTWMGGHFTNFADRDCITFPILVDIIKDLKARGFKIKVTNLGIKPTNIIQVITIAW